MTDDTASNAQLFLSRIRDHYVEQLLLFVAEQRRNSIRGEAEIIDFEPERILGFEPITATLGSAELEIENLRWDDVVIDHNGAFDAERILGAWFEKWFDPDDRRYRPGADLGNVIHSLVVEPGKLRIDFGSASPDAFWELLDRVEKAGATELRISSSQVDAASARPA